MTSYVPMDLRDGPHSDRRSWFECAPDLQRRLSSDELFCGRTEIGIEHHGAMYRLRITRQGKLILNK